MTHVEIDAGACGFKAKVTVERLDRETIQVFIESKCDQLTAMNLDLEKVRWQESVFIPMVQSLIYQSASEHISHAACPLPVAILKAVEVEVGIALPKDVIIRFEAT